MLRIVDTISRRKLLTLGTFGLANACCAWRLRASDTAPPVTGKSVVFVFQQGGPSQFETFDPKPAAPSGIATVTDTISTKLPGVAFAEPMSRLASLADRLTIVRNYQTNNAGHNIQPLVGPDSIETNIGVHFARVAGATHPGTGMPTNAVLYPRAVDEDVARPEARGNLSSTGGYGSGFAPFVPGAGGELQEAMEVRLDSQRFFEDRRRLLAELDRLNRQVDAAGSIDAVDQQQRQAYELLSGGGVSEALDLSREDPRTLARYDTSHFVRADGWNKVRRGERGYYTGQAKTIGHLLLLARRLCEAGCGFVTIHAGYAGVWDMHADGNNLNMVDGMEAVGRSFDHALAAFIEDVAERGLSERILLVASGEMGRTPRINKRGGRDHWAKLSPLLLSGGGYDDGRVIGQSTRDGAEPLADPQTPANLIATLLGTTLDLPQLRLQAGIPSELEQVTAAAPLPGCG